MLRSRMLWAAAERTTPRLSHATYTRHLAQEAVSQPWERPSPRGWQGQGRLAHGSCPDFRWLGLGELCPSSLPSETGHSAFKPRWSQVMDTSEPLCFAQPTRVWRWKAALPLRELALGAFVKLRAFTGDSCSLMGPHKSLLNFWYLLGRGTVAFLQGSQGFLHLGSHHQTHHLGFPPKPASFPLVFMDSGGSFISLQCVPGADFSFQQAFPFIYLHCISCALYCPSAPFRFLKALCSYGHNFTPLLPYSSEGLVHNIVPFGQTVTSQRLAWLCADAMLWSLLRRLIFLLSSSSQPGHALLLT